MKLHGYEWGFTCDDCGEHNDFDGGGLSATSPTVDGESGRIRAIELPADVECAHCGATVTLEAN